MSRHGCGLGGRSGWRRAEEELRGGAWFLDDSAFPVQAFSTRASRWMFRAEAISLDEKLLREMPGLRTGRTMANTGF